MPLSGPDNVRVQSSGPSLGDVLEAGASAALNVGGLAAGMPGLGSTVFSGLGTVSSSSDPSELLDKQRDLVDRSFRFSVNSALITVEHDTRMSVVRNLKA
jgi:hypothetical protein